MGVIITAGTNCGALGEKMFALKGVAGREGGDVACVCLSVFSCAEKASPGRPEIVTSPGTCVIRQCEVRRGEAVNQITHLTDFAEEGYGALNHCNFARGGWCILVLVL